MIYNHLFENNPSVRRIHSCVIISHAQSMKAAQSSVCSAMLLGFSGFLHLWSFCSRVPSSSRRFNAIKRLAIMSMQMNICLKVQERSSGMRFRNNTVDNWVSNCTVELRTGTMEWELQTVPKCWGLGQGVVKLQKFFRRNNKMGGWCEVGLKCRKLSGKTGVLAGMVMSGQRNTIKEGDTKHMQHGESCKMSLIWAQVEPMWGTHYKTHWCADVGWLTAWCPMVWPNFKQCL